VFFVEARYHRNPDKLPQQIRYISHREGRLQGGERRELLGIGDRYRVLRGDEKAIEKAFAEDTRGLRRPAYFRFILTVDNHAAERFARLDGTSTEWAIRDAIQKTFRGAARDVQGVFAIHQHGGHDRPAHPHVHALLSPRLQNGAPIHFSPRAIERVKQRWELEVLRGLARQERRLVRRQPHRELVPLTPLRQRGFKARQAVLRFDWRPHRRRRLGPLTLALLRSRPSRQAGVLAGRSADAALGPAVSQASASVSGGEGSTHGIEGWALSYRRGGSGSVGSTLTAGRPFNPRDRPTDARERPPVGVSLDLPAVRGIGLSQLPISRILCRDRSARPTPDWARRFGMRHTKADGGI